MTKIGSNLSAYLPNLMPQIGDYLQTQDAEKGQEILQQVLSAFSADQKEVLFNQVRHGNVPDPIKRLAHLVEDLGAGKISASDFLKESEKTVVSVHTVDGKEVKLPSPSDRLQKMNEALADGRLSNKELEMYSRLKSTETAGDANVREDGTTAADRFIDEAMKSKCGNNDLEKIKRMASGAADAEVMEDTLDVALLSAANPETAQETIDIASSPELKDLDVSEAAAMTGSRTGASRAGGTTTTTTTTTTTSEGGDSSGELSRSGSGGTSSRSGSSTGTSSRSGASTSSGSSSRSGASTGGGTASRSGAASDAGGFPTPSGISAPGNGGGGGVDVGNVTSIDLSPTEQQLYDKMKAEDPQAAARFFLQQKLAKISEMAAMLSNIAKMRHDAAMAIIGNMR